ncbi:hypothetical protein [Cupriavidus sp. 8B]
MDYSLPHPVGISVSRFRMLSEALTVARSVKLPHWLNGCFDVWIDRSLDRFRVRLQNGKQ